jgi:hypothetical protein
MFGGSEKIGRIGMMGDHRDTFRSIPILPILPIPNDTAVFGLTGKASARLVLPALSGWRQAGSLSYE